MDGTALTGGFADTPVEAALAFRAALDAMARPGTVHQVAGAEPPPPLSVAAGVLLLTLSDHDTPVWLAPSLAVPEVKDWLAFHTGAPIRPRAKAALAAGPWDEMLPLSDFPAGTPEYPDRSATLIIEVAEIGQAHRLTGPGIETEARLTVPDVEALRVNARCFPMGLDFFLTSGDRLAALPRTTRIG